MASSRPRRIALFCTNFLPTSQVFVYEQLRQYRRSEVEVFAWRRFQRERFPFPRVHLAEPSYVVRGRSRRFSRAFRQGRFDLVHAHFGPAGAYARRFAAQHGLPLLVTFHGYDVPLLSSPRRFLPLHLPYALGSRALLRELRLGLCASAELLQMLRELGVSEERLRVHRLGIDLDRFRFVAAPPDAAASRWWAGWWKRRASTYGLRAFAHARQLGQVARLAIVGEGERLASLQSLARALGIAEQVTLPGQPQQRAGGGAARPDQRLARAQRGRPGRQPRVRADRGEGSGGRRGRTDRHAPRWHSR